MDKIIFFIILLYVFSRLSRILKGEEGGKRRQYPLPPIPRQPHPRPPAQPPPGREGRPGQETRPGPVSRREEDALQILAEWERKAQRQKPGQIEGPSEWEREIQGRKPGRTEVPSEWEREIQRQKSGQIEVPSEMGEEPFHHRPASESLPRAEHLASIGYTEVEHTGEQPGDVWSREAEKEDILHLHHPSVLREGIILSEILRPAIVLRPFAPPYRRS